MKSVLTRRPVKLGNKIGVGGEGTVYETDVSGVVAKIYTKGIAPRLRRKLDVMLATPPQDDTWTKHRYPSIAWPTDIIRSGKRDIGVLMPRVPSSVSLGRIARPSTRRRTAPSFSWKYLVRAAVNLAAAVDSIHSKGYVIGDVNQRNVLVSSSALVSVIDTDSFQVDDPQSGRLYRCLVGTPDFTPPELIGSDFRHTRRESYHDDFGLAVLMFLLLYSGAFPFAGRWTGPGEHPPVQQLVLGGHYVFARRSKICPTKNTLPAQIVGPELALLFQRAFIEGLRDPRRRAGAGEWKSALERCLLSIQVCGAAQHHEFGGHLSRCPWCERHQTVGLDIFGSSPPRKKGRAPRRRRQRQPVLPVGHHPRPRTPVFRVYTRVVGSFWRLLGTIVHGATRRVRDPDTAAFLEAVGQTLRGAVTVPYAVAAIPGSILAWWAAGRSSVGSWLRGREHWAAHTASASIVGLACAIALNSSGAPSPSFPRLASPPSEGTERSRSRDPPLGTRQAAPSPSESGERMRDAVDRAEREAVTPGRVARRVPDAAAATIRLKADVRVLAYPWAEVYIDGMCVAEETPAQCELAAGAHAILLRHPTKGDLSARIEIDGSRSYTIKGLFHEDEIRVESEPGVQAK